MARKKFDYKANGLAVFKMLNDFNNQQMSSDPEFNFTAGIGELQQVRIGDHALATFRALVHAYEEGRGDAEYEADAAGTTA